MKHPFGKAFTLAERCRSMWFLPVLSLKEIPS